MEVIEFWGTVSPDLEALMSGAGAWAPLLDLVSHEHDIRGAIGRPGARDSPAVHHGARALCTRVAGVPRSIRVVWEDGEGRMGGGSGPDLVLRRRPVFQHPQQYPPGLGGICPVGR